MNEFNAFWTAYPRRVGKLAAMNAYVKARRLATAEEILAGVENYKRHLPEPQFICHASTFLNQGRWMDEYDEPVVREQFPDCDHEPRCANKRWCAALRWKAAQGA